MLNLLRLVLCLNLLLLQACQQKYTLNQEGTIKAAKQNNAALYNTQLGLAYLKQGDIPRAKRKLLRALDIEPNSADVNAALAYFLEKTGDLKEARNYFKKALSLAPGNGAQLNNYGSYLCRYGDYKEAERYFLNAVKDVHYVHTAGAYENAGLCAAAIPDYPKALQYFNQALKHDPQRKQSLYELVRIELKQNHAEKALAYMKTYSKLTLNDSALLTLAGEAAHRLGKSKIEEAYKLRLKNLNNF
ncbi:MAG: type IV pilus biogenesis/stability protein PilW [Tatlockia sp.]|nr:type IV pilus biogenesis/stability protein PilW [Tatlockia sp.]